MRQRMHEPKWGEGQRERGRGRRKGRESQADSLLRVKTLKGLQFHSPEIMT